MQSRSLPERALLIGLDLGGSGFRAWRIEQTGDQPLALTLDLASDGIERAWPTHGFAPVPLDEQLLEQSAGGMRLRDDESREGRDRIGLLALALRDLSAPDELLPLRVALAAPGLRVRGGRGLAVVRNGPRVPDLCARLEERARALGVRRLARIPSIAGDGVAGAWGELVSRGGALSVPSGGAYYAAGGSGLAEALVVDGRPRALDELAGVEKAWEARGADGLALEDHLAPGRWMAHARSKGERPEALAARGDVDARELFERFARAFGELVARRAADLARHARRDRRLARVVVGGALARVLAREENRWIRERVEDELARRLGDAAPALALSALPAAPALGAVAVAIVSRVWTPGGAAAP